MKSVKKISAVGITLFIALAVSVRTAAQEQPSAAALTALESRLGSGNTVPRLVRFSGVVKNSARAIPAEGVSLTFTIYEVQQGGTPLWTETQNVLLNQN